MNIGIDLGTTFSVLTVNGQVTLNKGYGDGIYIEECDVTIIPSPYAEQSFPSVAIENPDSPGELLFGTDALSVADEEHALIMFSKRKIGSDELITSGSIQLTAKDFASAFLSYLKKCAENALGTTVERAVITHPAYFDRIAVEQTREAAVSAGFKMDLVEQMVMEPVTAALAYTRTDKRDPLNIVTYDLGGGTFDVTVLQRQSGIIDIKAFDGDHLLGGYNFDRELVHWVRKQLETRGRTIDIDMATDAGKAAVSNLLRAAESVKIELAKAVDEKKMIEFRARRVIKDSSGKDVPINERISREEFTVIIAKYLDRTIDSCNRALKKSNLQVGDIHEILLVGGSSYAPWVEDAIKTLFPKITPKLFMPDLCVGIGAAIHSKAILPKQCKSDDYTLQLDIPEITSIETIHVIGELSGRKRETLNNITLLLKDSSGKQLDKTSLDADSKFMFSNVELMTIDGENQFDLEIIDTNQNMIFSHSFCITHETEGSDTSTITTVLPKPLYIETYDGLVPVAKEGVSLPTRISETFQRLNSNPNFDINLFQDNDKIGVIRVEDMPPEGGKGAFLDLNLHVTQKNEIKGTVTIRKEEIGFQTERIISIKFNVVETPSSDVLKSEINRLKDKIGTLSSSENLITSENITSATNLIKEAEELFDQIPLELQEIHALLKNAMDTLQPQKDEMRPSQKEFNEKLNKCKQICTKLIESAKGIANEDDTSKGLDKSMIQSAGVSIHKAKEILKRLDNISADGIEAVKKKEKRKWLILNNKLEQIQANIQKDEKLQIPPIIYNKLLAKSDIAKKLQRFFDACHEIEAEGKINDWETELRAIYSCLIKALHAIHDISDELADEDGLKSIRNVYKEQINDPEIDERINQIGTGKGLSKI